MTKMTPVQVIRMLLCLCLAVTATALPGQCWADNATPSWYTIAPPAAGSYIMAHEASRSSTVTVRLGFPEIAGRHRLWLAGLGMSPEGPPTALSLSLVGQSSGWFGFTGSLRLESTAGLIATSVLTKAEATPLGSVGYLELGPSIPLLEDHAYEATLAYDGNTGLAAVRFLNRTEGHVLYEGHLYIRPSAKDFFPGAGSLHLDSTLASDWRPHIALEVLPRGQRLGAPIPLREAALHLNEDDPSHGEPTRSPRPKPGSAQATASADKPLDLTITGVLHDGLGPEWRLRVQAAPVSYEGTAEQDPITLWQGQPGATSGISIPAGRLAPGRYRLALEYVEPGFVAPLAEEEIAVVAARVAAQVVVLQNRPWETDGVISGEIMLVADRDVPAVELSLTAAPESSPERQRVVWQQPVSIREGEELVVPFSFSGMAEWSPYTFSLDYQAPQPLLLTAEYHTPRVFHVSPAGDDTWSGYLDSAHADRSAGPFRTIGKAARVAQAGDTVIIHSGVYREAVVISSSGTEERPITFRAAPAANVTLTGADLLADWVREPGDDSIYSTPWPHAFISWSANHAHPGDDFHMLIGRAEQVYSGGYPLRQVLSRDRMERGTFYVDLLARRLYVWNADNRDISKLPVEAATRNVIWDIRGDHVHVHGIRFRYAANRAQEGAVRIAGNHNLLEDCVIERMNGSGAAFLGQHLTVRRCLFQDNGQLGFGANRAHHLLFTESVVRNNNTKGFNRDWEAGGNKLAFTRAAVLEKSVFADNKGAGIWFDIGNEEATVRNNLIAGNEAAGIFYEISFGLHAHDNVIVGNGGPVDIPRGGAWGANGGISISSSPHCLIERNLLVGNREGFQFREQIRFTPLIDDPREKPVWNHDEVIRHNVIAYNHDAQTWGWFDVPDNRHWPGASAAAHTSDDPGELSLEKLNITFADNLYATTAGQGLFNWSAQWRGAKYYTDLHQVRQELNLEQGSVVAPLALGSYHRFDLRVPADSPALLMGNYPQGAVPGVLLGTLPD